MNKGLGFALVVELIGIIVVLAGIVDLLPESTGLTGQVLIPMGSLLIAAGGMFYAKFYDGTTVFTDSADNTSGENPQFELSEFETVEYRVNKLSDGYIWSLGQYSTPGFSSETRYQSEEAARQAAKEFHQRFQDAKPVVRTTASVSRSSSTDDEENTVNSKLDELEDRQ